VSSNPRLPFTSTPLPPTAITSWVANFGRSRLSGGLSKLFFLIALIALSLSLPSCRQAPTTPTVPPRYAVLRFENLSSDPSLDWTSRALNESLPASLASALDGPVLPSSALSRAATTMGTKPAAAPGISTQRQAALFAGANRIVTGYIERVNGLIRIAAVVRDLITGTNVRTVIATGTSPYAAIVGISQQLSPRAKPPISTNPEALQAFATAFESTPTVAGQLLERATALDPGFGDAWLALASYHVGINDRAGAAATIEEAEHQKLDDLSRARLDLESANLRGDRLSIIAAMRNVVALTPADTMLLRTLAELETSAGQFKDAAAHWSRMAAAYPEDGLIWNSLGYTRAYAGDYTGAVQALQQYDRLRPNDANPQDSLGDVNYMHRHFKDAEANYTEAHKRQPDFEAGGDLYKAAWARFEAGDQPGADAIFKQYRTASSKSNTDAATLIEGDWRYRTGRRQEAVAMLRKFVAETQSAPLRADAAAELTVWSLLEGNRAQAAKDSALIGNSSSSLPVFIARFASLPSATPSEWEQRAQRMVPPTMGSLRALALGYALLLDGKSDAARPVWQVIVNQASATDFFIRAVYAHVQGVKPDLALLPQPGNLNPFAAILESS
jgi:tetratricopeptide (TPR) repeat protein